MGVARELRLPYALLVLLLLSAVPAPGQISQEAVGQQVTTTQPGPAPPTRPDSTKAVTTDPYLELLKATVPLLAVLLTAVLSGYVVPRITRRWQDHQKELEVKTTLVESINSAILEFILAMQFMERKASTQEDFDKAYKQWESKYPTLVGRIRVYFRSSNIADELDAFFEKISEFYALAGIYNVNIRSAHINKLKSYFGTNATDWSLLEDQNKRKTDLFTWFESWWRLRQEILFRKDLLIRKLLDTPIKF